jgi:two-component system LytT family sensor kinase
VAQAVTLLAIVVVLGLVALGARRLVSSRRALGGPAERATFATLHTASLAAPPLRDGLTVPGAQRAARHLRALLGTPAVALTDGTTLLAWDGVGEEHRHLAAGHAAEATSSGRTVVLPSGSLPCRSPDCELRTGVVAPLTVEDRVVGSIAAYGPGTSAALVRATAEVAKWVSTQLELAELDESRARLMEAEVRALRAQISPHFIYNSLTAIASFVRTDPERARDLLLDFADFTRYSFRRHGDYTTLAEELRSVERYLVLEKARFGDRLEVTLRVAPEVLPVAVPFLCLQPLVENAVRHGLEGRPGGGRVTIVAEDVGAEAHISVEDDGAGMDPAQAQAVLSGAPDGDSIGLGNVDARMRQVYGDEYGLVLETAPGAGTRVSLRVPKYHPDVRAS